MELGAGGRLGCASRMCRVGVPHGCGSCVWHTGQAEAPGWHTPCKIPRWAWGRVRLGLHPNPKLFYFSGVILSAGYRGWRRSHKAYPGSELMARACETTSHRWILLSMNPLLWQGPSSCGRGAASACGAGAGCISGLCGRCNNLKGGALSVLPSCGHGGGMLAQNEGGLVSPSQRLPGLGCPRRYKPRTMKMMTMTTPPTKGQRDQLRGCNTGR